MPVEDHPLRALFFKHDLILHCSEDVRALRRKALEVSADVNFFPVGLGRFLRLLLLREAGLEMLIHLGSKDVLPTSVALL